MKKMIGLVLVVAVLLAACGSGSADNKGAKSREATPGEITINGDYVVPPTAHGNPFIGGYIGGGMEPYLQDTLFSFTPMGEDNYKSHLAESYEITGNKVKVTLRENLKWSDDTPLTAEDVVTSYQMWIGKKQVWEYLESISALDNRTIEFDFKIDSKLMLNLLADVRISASQKEYGDWASKYAEIAASGREWHDETSSFWFLEEATEKLTKLNEKLDDYKPDVTKTMNSGAFVLDSLTTGEAVLVGNPAFYNETGVDKLKIVRATTPEVAANAMIDGTLDIHSGGMTADLIKQVKGKIKGYTEFYLPEYSQMSVVFNINQPFAKTKAFREAMGYLMNTEEMLPLAEVGSMPAENSASGLPLSLQSIFEVEEWAKTNLSQKKYDPDQAKKILLAAGWKQGSDDKWTDETGKKVAFELSSNNGWGSALLPGEAYVNELQNFGFDVTFKPMEGAAYDAYLRNGEHTVAIEFAPPSNILYANPYGSYEQLYRGRAWLFGLEATPAGELFLENAAGEKVDVIALTKRLFTETGAEFTATTKELMEITNENALFIPYLEKGFPVRILKTNIDLGVKDGSLVQDARFSGVAETMFAALISEGTLNESIKK